MVSRNLLIASLLSVVSVVNAISVLSIKGSKFFNAEGQQVFFKGTSFLRRVWILTIGIAYQRSPYDPFVNETQCQLDAQLMKKLGANAIRCTAPQ
jgi:hypothetical protein